MKSILVTGGTGELGRVLVAALLSSGQWDRIAVFANDEQRQFAMQQEYIGNETLRWFIGDVRDVERLKLAFDGVNHVVHTAEMRLERTGDRHPIEMVKTNILGTQNVIDAAIERSVPNVLIVSSLDARNPTGVYGSTKLCAERLALAANGEATHFSITRVGYLATPMEVASIILGCLHAVAAVA